MKQYTIYCTPEQCEKALDLGAPIRYKDTLDNRERGKFEIPTAEEMIGWLDTQDIYVLVLFNLQYSLFDYKLVVNARKKDTAVIENNKSNSTYYDTRAEATLAAISSALEYLTNNKE